MTFSNLLLKRAGKYSHWIDLALNSHLSKSDVASNPTFLTSNEKAPNRYKKVQQPQKRCVGKKKEHREGGRADLTIVRVEKFSSFIRTLVVRRQMVNPAGVGQFWRGVQFLKVVGNFWRWWVHSEEHGRIVVSHNFFSESKRRGTFKSRRNIDYNEVCFCFVCFSRNLLKRPTSTATWVCIGVGGEAWGKIALSLTSNMSHIG